MILRIEIYDAVSYEQIREARRIIATFLNVPMESVTVEELPEADESVGDEEYIPPTHPEEGDWHTSDYQTWYKFNCREKFYTDPFNWIAEMKAKMEEDEWWPNLWYLSERGVWELLNVQTGKYFSE